MFQIFSVSVLTISVVLDFIGLIVNLFIAVINYKTWVQSHGMSSSDRILFSLGITRFLMMGMSLVNICFFISPNVERDLQVIFFGGSQSLQDFTGEIIPYEKIFIHPNFTATSPKNDLMLIKLSLPFIFVTEFFQLPTLVNNEVKDCLVHTWLQGEDYFGNQDYGLHSIHIQLNPHLDCTKLLGKKFLEDMFCMRNKVGSQQPCQISQRATTQD
ncbi:PREDICTED: probable inactive serine protease 58 [Myotis brandtii]|uniref:probable inactive serine protease 58 n=1 Tax=Myotis brandtii TaxID=109478 RepID=UPI000704537C|nr:PREDICTED: probable inactive serine protease 58 [Myotis brandtii]